MGCLLYTSTIQIVKTNKVKVGIVGEIYVKYSPLANNDLEKFLFDEGAEVVVPGLLDFIIFKADNRIVDVELYGGCLLYTSSTPVRKSHFRRAEAACSAASTSRNL